MGMLYYSLIYFTLAKYSAQHMTSDFSEESPVQTIEYYVTEDTS